MMSEDFCAQSGAICLRIIAHALLGPVERDEWRALQVPVRRKREWLFGRGALKEAVRAWVMERSGHLLYPSDILVSHDERGAPMVSGWWCDTLTPSPQVSLSHTASRCLVGVAPAGQALGVDLEELGRIRKPELLATWLAPQEAALVTGLSGPALDERLLRLWCAKEAASKALGIGLQGRPEAFVVSALDAAFDNLLVSHVQGNVEAKVAREANTIMAVAGRDLISLELQE
jgi:phosphopantetheinyl transferase